MPARPPRPLISMAAIEIRLAPQSNGAKLPKVPPRKAPVHTTVLRLT